MRIVVQRVLEASVTISGNLHSSIGKGLMVLVGIEDADDNQDMDWIATKVVNLRIFDDDQKVPNLSLSDVNGELLLVSQFTLHASVKKGNRPSYIMAARPEVAITIYETFISKLESLLGKKISTGVFGADMQVSLINDGPITIIIDSKNKDF